MVAFTNTLEKIIADPKIITAGDLFLVKPASGQNQGPAQELLPHPQNH